MGRSTPAASDNGEETGDVMMDADSTERADKQVEISSAGQTVGCDLGLA
jgi:hypothetical protein